MKILKFFSCVFLVFLDGFICGVNVQLMKQNELLDKGLTYIGFKEPDLDNQLTAISCLTDTNIFKSLQVLK